MSEILHISETQAFHLCYSPCCICTVHVIRSLNCQYQHMHNFNVIG